MIHSFTSAISIRGVSVTFGGRQLLSGFDLELKPGEKVVLAGRSGSGKTTLLRALLGFYVPDVGTVSVGGLHVSATNVASVRQWLGWLPQQAEPGADTVREALCLPLEFKSNNEIAGGFSDLRLQEVLRQVGLERIDLESESSRLSGGEKQRLAIARALLLDRPIWLVDEPTSSLDAETKVLVMDCILGATERTILAISHDEEFLRRFDRVVYVDGGSQHG
jgi:putative ABC transport system ATP-binding protein